MKALTIKQPWAELIIAGLKDVENRSRRTGFRGRFAVHAGLKRADFEDLDLASMPRMLQRPVVGAWERHANPGRVILADPRPYARPVAAKGQLGLWEWRR